MVYWKYISSYYYSYKVYWSHAELEYQKLDNVGIFIWVKGHASTNQGLATPLLHAVLFKVALHSSHANLYMNRLDKENMTTLFAKTLFVQ